jgi:small subunit ribosomal protein S8
MSMTDSLADMLTRVRNAQRAGHDRAEVPASKLKMGVAKVLKKEGYIKNYKLIQDKKQGMLRIYLKYDDGNEPVIRGLKRISKPGRRVYSGYDNIPPVLGGFGVVVISTSKGIITDREARAQKMGGEVLCQVW